MDRLWHKVKCFFGKHTYKVHQGYPVKDKYAPPYMRCVSCGKSFDLML